MTIGFLKISSEITFLLLSDGCDVIVAVNFSDCQSSELSRVPRLRVSQRVAFVPQVETRVLIESFYNPSSA